MKHAIIGDIHGRLDLLIMVISRLKKNGIVLGKDTLVFLGDYCDRGKQSKQVVQYLTNLKNKFGDKIVLLKGNHEELAENYVKCSYKDRFRNRVLWFGNGGNETVKSFKEDGIDNILMPFINKLQLYYETKDFICVHGGIPNRRNVKNVSAHELMWHRDNYKYDGKLQIVGHSIVEQAIQINNTLFVDTGAFATDKLSAVIMPDMKVVVTKKVMVLEETY